MPPINSNQFAVPKLLEIRTLLQVQIDAVDVTLRAFGYEEEDGVQVFAEEDAPKFRGKYDPDFEGWSLGDAIIGVLESSPVSWSLTGLIKELEDGGFQFPTPSNTKSRQKLVKSELEYFREDSYTQVEQLGNGRWRLISTDDE